MGIDVVERVSEKLCIDRGPRSGIRNWANRSWQNELIHELSGLRITPLEDPGRKIRTGQDNVVISHGNAKISGGRNQSRGWRKCILGDLHGNFIVPALRGQSSKEFLQHVVLEGHGSARACDRVEGSGVPLVHFLQTYQLRLDVENLSCHRPHPFWRIGALDLRNHLADTEQELKL